MGYKYSVSIKFFREWSDNMAYVLGFLYADGCIMKSRYRIKFSSNDQDLLINIRNILQSDYPILPYLRKNRRFPNFSTIVDSKKMYLDLQNLGLTPQKSKSMKLPYIPQEYFPHFIRGYLDGDGSIYYDKPTPLSNIRLNTSFSCGSHNFLDKLQKSISQILGIKHQNVISNRKRRNAYCIRYSTKDSLKFLEYIYQNSVPETRLERKFRKYKNYIENNCKKA